MTAPNSELIWIVSIDFISRADRSTVTTRYFSDRSWEPNELLSSGQNYKIWGILVDANRLGSSVSGELPSERKGTVILNNTRDSIGGNKRFSDWLVTEEIITQSVTIKYLFKSITEYGNSDTSLTTEFAGSVLNVQGEAGNTASIEVTADPITRYEPQYFIDRANHPNTSDRANGQYLPMIFGTAQTPAYLIQDADDGDYYWGYATDRYSTNGTTIDIKSNPTVLIKTFREDYVEYSDSGGITATASPSATEDLSANGKEGGWVFGNSVNDLGSVIYRVDCDFYGVNNGSAVVSGTTVCNIYEIDETVNAPGRLAAFGVVDNTDYTTEIRANASFTLSFALNNPVVFEHARGYLVTFQVIVDNPGTDKGPLLYTGFNAFGNHVQWYKEQLATAESLGWRENSSYANPVDLTLYDITIQFSANTDSYAFLAVELPAAPTNQEWPKLSRLNFIVESGGLIDDGSGTITGSASQPINRTDWIVKSMLGDDFTIDLSTFDVANVLGTTFPRTVSGATQGQTGLRTTLQQICKDTACKIIPRRDGSLAVWAYGFSTSDVKYISEFDCNLVRWQFVGTEQIVNYVALAYNRKATPLSNEELQSGAPSNYANSLVVNGTSGHSISGTAADSQDLYGERRLAFSYTTSPWIVDDVAAIFLAKYYIERNNRSQLLFSVRVPFTEYYADIELMDKIKITHIDAPSEFGTVPAGSGKFPTDSTGQHTAINSNEVWRQARLYEMQVIGRQCSINLQSKSKGAELILELRSLEDKSEIH